MNESFEDILDSLTRDVAKNKQKLQIMSDDQFKQWINYKLMTNEQQEEVRILEKAW